MTADVQSWLDTPASNFGWIVVGVEGTAGTAKRFDTRESTTPPVLTIDYTAPAPPAAHQRRLTQSARRIGHL